MSILASDRRIRGRSRSFERASTASPPDQAETKSIDAPTTGRGRSRVRARPASTTSTYEPLTRSRKARVFQDRKSSAERTKLGSPRSHHASRSDEDSVEYEDQRRNPHELLLPSSQEKSPTFQNKFSASTDRSHRNTSINRRIVRNRSTDQPPSSSETTDSRPTAEKVATTAVNKPVSISRQSRRFSHRAPQINNVPPETTSEAPRGRLSTAAKPSKFSKLPAKDKELLPEYVNTAIYEQNYPDHYKMLIRSKIGSEEPKSEKSNSFKTTSTRTTTLRKEPEIKMDPTTFSPFKNRYTTRQNFKISLPAYQRTSTTPKPKSTTEFGPNGDIDRRDRPMGFSSTGFGGAFSKKSPQKFSSKINTNLPLRRNFALFAARPTVLPVFSKKFQDITTAKERNPSTNSAPALESTSVSETLKKKKPIELQ